MPVGFVSPKCAARPCPHAEEHRSARGRLLRQPPLRCDASRSMRGVPPPHPSRRAHARLDLRHVCRTRAPQDEAAQGIPNSRFVAEPFSVIPISRCQTAHLVPAAHFCARVLPLCFTHPERGVGGAPRNVRVQRHPLGVPSVRHKTRVNALMTRHARRLARRLASHDAGRSPLGAPPWRFWASGPRFRLLRRPPSYNGRQLPSDPCSELLAARS